MSSTQSLLIIAFIVLIIVVMAVVIVMNKRYIHQIAQIDQQTDALKDIAVEDAISRLKKMELSGESLKTFTTWRDNYQQLIQETQPELKKILIQAANNNSRYALFKAGKQIRNAQRLLDQGEQDLKDSKAFFNQLLESNRDNKIQYDALLKKYRKIRKNVLATGFDYSFSLDQIENQLAEMETDFDSVKNLSAQGDHVEAKRVLSKINMSLNEFSSRLPILKKREIEIKHVFPTQLSELSISYKKMIQEKYRITDIDVLATIKQIHIQISASEKLAASLQTDELEKSNQQIAEKIDHLYDVLGKELHARPFVEKNQDKIIRLLSRVGTSSQQLVAKLDHIDKSYELTHGELEEAENLSNQVARLNDQYDLDIQQLAEGKGVYSKVKESWLQTLEKLTKIEKREKEISDSVDELFSAEKIARESIEQFKQQVSLIYRRTQRRRLPGKPDSFVQMYTLVVNEIAQTDEALQQVRINMEKISQSLIQIKEDVDRLHKEADDLIHSADLCELFMQYSNKYLNYGSIKKARAQAMKYYQSFDYHDALDTIGTELEKIEPGSFARIEKNYVENKNN